jgi:hypothetical protein
VGALVDGPLDRVDDLVAGAAVRSEHLADERARHAGRHADARVLHVTTEDGAGAVRAVAVLVAVAFAGEVALDERHAGEGRVRRVDPGVEDGDRDAGSGEGRGIGLDRLDAPRRRRRGGRRGDVPRLADRGDQLHRHGRSHRQDPAAALDVAASRGSR